MAIPATNLPETVGVGSPNFIPDVRTAWDAINAVTALLSGADLIDRDAVLIALGLPLLVLWTPGVGWGTYSTNVNLVRFFLSPANSDATFPNHYNAQNRDIWFRLG